MTCHFGESRQQKYCSPNPRLSFIFPIASRVRSHAGQHWRLFWTKCASKLFGISHVSIQRLGIQYCNIIACIELWMLMQSLISTYRLPIFPGPPLFDIGSLWNGRYSGWTWSRSWYRCQMWNSSSLWRAVCITNIAARPIKASE